MKSTIVCTLLAVAASSAVQLIAPVQPGYISPQATGYIYRSDNNGPASLIQLGAQHYQQPQIFAPPIPLQAQPLVHAEQPIYEVVQEVAPAPLPYVAAPIVEAISEEDDNDDDSSEESEEYVNGGELGLGHGHGHGHGYEEGEGSNYGEEHHAAHGEKGSKGYNSQGHHAKGDAGHYAKEHNEGYNSEAAGKKGSHHDEADAHGSHHEAGKSYKGGDHGHKKHFSKGEEVTGYHKRYNKDEFKKDHDFYDVADNSGHFNKHGYQKAHHGSEEGAHKEGGHLVAGHAKKEFGKSGSHAEGNHGANDAGHSAEEGNESHYSQEEDFGKKGAAAEEKEFGYADAHPEDYDD